MSDSEIDEYDYILPEHLIAKFPPEKREDARLMVVDRARGTIEHGSILDLPRLLRAGDCLTLNNTRVLKARLLGERLQTGGRWEGLFLETTASGAWRLLGQTRGKLRPGEAIRVYPAFAPNSADRLILKVEEKDAEGIWTAMPEGVTDPVSVLERFGTLPLPPYMKRESADSADFVRYQTVYARESGSVAAPTAGLHFTPQLLEACETAGIPHFFVTLHVGIGTFRPISAARLCDHKMHAEHCELSPEVAASLRAVRASNGRIVAVGTTTVRTLESSSQSGRIDSFKGQTSIFIKPGHQFQAIDALLTNFHLPKSSLLVLVSAFAGRDLISKAYALAIREKYRFFSYGDAMLIL